LKELTNANVQLASDLKLCKDLLESRDREITRLGSLYQADLHIDKVTDEYNRGQLIKRAEQLQKQLDFLNGENNTLTSN